MQVDHVNLSAWESSRARAEECDYCGLKEKEPKFNLQTKSYYRGKNGLYYFFCSDKCRAKYRNEYVCHACGYGSSLRKVSGEDWVFCIDYPGHISCYDKFMGILPANLPNKGRCDFCQEDDAAIAMTKKIQNAHDNLNENYDEYRCCNRCFEAYCEITTNKRMGEDFNICDVCEFCNREEDLCDINLYKMCGECREIYKLFVFGPDN